MTDSADEPVTDSASAMSTKSMPLQIASRGRTRTSFSNRSEQEFHPLRNLGCLSLGRFGLEVAQPAPRLGIPS